MRLLVSRLCGSINARARFETTRRSHTFSKLRTLDRDPLGSPSPWRDVLYEKKPRGRLFILPTRTTPSTIQRGTTSRHRDARFPPGFNFLRAFLARDRWSSSRKMCRTICRGEHIQKILRSYRKKKLRFIIGWLLFAITTIELFNGKSCVT